MLIEKELICLDVDLHNKEEIIDYLSRRAQALGRINNLKEYQQAVRLREKEFSTALGYLVAIPHGQSEGVNEPFIVFGRLKNEVIWDKEPVKMVFLIGVPMKNRSRTHMMILAHISKSLISDSFRQSLLEAKTVEDVHKILAEIEKKEKE